MLHKMLAGALARQPSQPHLCDGSRHMFDVLTVLDEFNAFQALDVKHAVSHILQNDQ